MTPIEGSEKLKWMKESRREMKRKEGIVLRAFFLFFPFLFSVCLGGKKIENGSERNLSERERKS